MDIKTSLLQQQFSDTSSLIPSKRPYSERTGVVYQIPCADCDKSYVGQTGKTLSQRLKKHQRAVTTLDTSALAEHVLAEDGHINWKETTIIGQYLLTQPICIVKSWYITHLPNTLNRVKLRIITRNIPRF